MGLKEPPVGIPSLVSIATFQPALGEGDTTAASSLVEELRRREMPGLTVLGSDNSLVFGVGFNKVYVEFSQEEGFQSILFSVSPEDGGSRRGLSPQVQKSCEACMASLTELLEEGVVSVFTLRIGEARGLREARGLVEGYLVETGVVARSVGVARSCLFSTVGERALHEGGGPFTREIVVVPFSPAGVERSSALWGLLRDLVSLSSYAGRLNHLRSGRDLMLRQVDASEESTQVRIDEILMGLRRPAGELKPDDLEEVLREVTVLFSRLSVLASSMRRDYVKASAVLRHVGGLFEAWNEESVEGYASNSSVEMHVLEGLVASFKDFVDRVEALRAQLDTVLDAVRTYLGIQSQRLSVEEQRSSREQLVRLVSLQEILHKLEVVIVAFYLTEMARLLFEALAAETANLLTVAFIPAAFLVAIAVMRILHRGSGGGAASSKGRDGAEGAATGP